MENIISSVVIQHIEEEPCPVILNHINGDVLPPKDALTSKVNPQSDDSSEYESAGSTKSSSTQSVNEIVRQEMAEKTVTPNLLGNALKAMKNLFSPDKVKNKPLNASTPSVQKSGKVENESNDTNDRKMETLDVSALSGRLSSMSLESSSNVNDDSFITSYSRVDDSFQSTYTHLGDQNLSDPMSCNDEEERNNETFVEAPIDFNLDSSINETSPAQDNLENTVLIKKDSLDSSAEVKEGFLETTVVKIDSEVSPGNLEKKVDVKCSTPIKGQNVICSSENKTDGDIKDDIPNSTIDLIGNETIDLEFAEIYDQTVDLNSSDISNSWRLLTENAGEETKISVGEEAKENLSEDSVGKKETDANIEEYGAIGINLVEEIKEEKLLDENLKVEVSNVLEKKENVKTVDSEVKEVIDENVVENGINKSVVLETKEILAVQEEDEIKNESVNSQQTDESVAESEVLNRTFELEREENVTSPENIYPVVEHDPHEPSCNLSDFTSSKTFLSPIPETQEPKENFSPAQTIYDLLKTAEITEINLGSPIAKEESLVKNLELPESKENFAASPEINAQPLDPQESKEYISVVPVIEHKPAGSDRNIPESIENLSPVINDKTSEYSKSEGNCPNDPEKCSNFPEVQENVSAAPAISGVALENVRNFPESNEKFSTSPELNDKSSNFLESNENPSEKLEMMEDNSGKKSDFPVSNENFLASTVDPQESDMATFAMNGITPRPFLASLGIDVHCSKSEENSTEKSEEVREENSERNSDCPVSSENFLSSTVDPQESDVVTYAINGITPETFLASLGIGVNRSKSEENSTEKNKEVLEENSEINSNFPVSSENFLASTVDPPESDVATFEINGITPETFLASLGIGVNRSKSEENSTGKHEEIVEENSDSKEPKDNISPTVNGQLSNSPESKENFSPVSEISEKKSESEENISPVRAANNSSFQESKENFSPVPAVSDLSAQGSEEFFSPARAIPDSSFQESKDFPSVSPINGKSPVPKEKLSEVPESRHNFSTVFEISDKTLNVEIKEVVETIAEKNRSLKIEDVVANNFTSDEIKVSTLNVELVTGKTMENVPNGHSEENREEKFETGEIGETPIEKLAETPKSKKSIVSESSRIFSPNVALLDSSIHSELEKFQKGDSSFNAFEINKDVVNQNEETKVGEGPSSENSPFDFLNKNTEEDLISGMRGLKLDDSFKLMEDFPLDDKLSSPSEKSESDLTQLIQEQFTANDIEKICSFAEELPVLNRQIMRASQVFDKSVHEKFGDENGFTSALSPEGLDFLDSIQGKTGGRDFSRESLYVKFDPLVEPSKPRTEILLQITPPKQQPVNVVAPLTPVSRKKEEIPEENNSKVIELQMEIEKLRKLISQKESSHHEMMNEYENQIAKLTGQTCVLEDKLLESQERERSLVKKLKDQRENIFQLQRIMEEFTKGIDKLTKELAETKAKNKEEMDALKAERDSYMTHLQNTEAAFSDVHVKYEKSKKTIEYYREKEVIYKNTITEQSQLIEDHKEKAMEIKEKAVRELNKIHNEIDELKASHAQETSRVRAQLRKTELKVQALQESLEQKIKENKELTTICDDLIAGKK